MATADGSAHRPAGETWQRVDALVQRFEEAWQAGQRPIFRAYLHRESALTRIGEQHGERKVLCDLALPPEALDARCG